MSEAVLDYALSHIDAARRHVVSRLRVPIDDAEDVVQEALMKIVAAKPEVENAQGYWATTLKNEARSYFRKKHEAVPLDDVPPQAQPISVADEPLDVADGITKLRSYATNGENRTLDKVIAGEQMTGTDRVNVHRLKQKATELQGSSPAGDAGGPVQEALGFDAALRMLRDTLARLRAEQSEAQARAEFLRERGDRMAQALTILAGASRKRGSRTTSQRCRKCDNYYASKHHQEVCRKKVPA